MSTDPTPASDPARPDPTKSQITPSDSTESLLPAWAVEAAEDCARYCLTKNEYDRDGAYVQARLAVTIAHYARHAPQPVPVSPPCKEREELVERLRDADRQLVKEGFSDTSNARCAILDAISFINAPAPTHADEQRELQLARQRDALNVRDEQLEAKNARIASLEAEAAKWKESSEFWGAEHRAKDNELTDLRAQLASTNDLLELARKQAHWEGERADILAAPPSLPQHAGLVEEIRKAFVAKFGEHANNKEWRRRQEGMNVALDAITALSAQGHTHG